MAATCHKLQSADSLRCGSLKLLQFTRINLPFSAFSTLFISVASFLEGVLVPNKSSSLSLSNRPLSESKFIWYFTANRVRFSLKRALVKINIAKLITKIELSKTPSVLQQKVHPLLLCRSLMAETSKKIYAFPLELSLISF